MVRLECDPYKNRPGLVRQPGRRPRIFSEQLARAHVPALGLVAQLVRARA